jgi:superfamily II DNA/RNA helicase
VSLFCLPLPSIPLSFFQIQRAGFPSPTPIQAQSWPIALLNQDVVAIAKTGSGKTLGYLLPGFMHIKRMQNSTRSGPTVLVLAPTRELATQILEEAVKFGRSSRISSTVSFLCLASSWIICSLSDPLFLVSS